MNVHEFLVSPADASRREGPHNRIVLSSRVRLARNVSGVPFLAKCTRTQRHQLEKHIRETILGAGISSSMLYVDMETAPQIDRDLLVERAPRVVARDQILDQVWGAAWETSSRTLDTHIASLRAKVGATPRIRTVRGVGYLLDEG